MTEVARRHLPSFAGPRLGVREPARAAKLVEVAVAMQNVAAAKEEGRSWRWVCYHLRPP